MCSWNIRRICQNLYFLIITICSFSFETSDGVSRSEEGVLKNVGTDDEAIEVRGSYTHTGPDGVVYTVNYVADENGFQPEGAHLPVA